MGTGPFPADGLRHIALSPFEKHTDPVGIRRAIVAGIAITVHIGEVGGVRDVWPVPNTLLFQFFESLIVGFSPAFQQSDFPVDGVYRP